MKLWVKGRRFDTTEEIHAETQEIIDTLTFENFQGRMKSWETGWDRRVHAQGDYFEGDGGN
jgi:chloramphenicol 3-O-phosphotransferase